MRTDGPVAVALDGSLHSLTTLKWGLAEAELRQAPALLTRVTEGPGQPLPELAPGMHDAPDREAAAYLQGLRERESVRRPGLEISISVLRGPHVPALRSLSDEAQLLVVGARGRPGRDPVGRVSGNLAAHARCPVAVVRERDLRSHDHSAPVVIGVDGSTASRAAAELAAREAALRRCPLVVLHADPSASARIAAARGTPSREGWGPAMADEVVGWIRHHHPDVDVSVRLLARDAVDALVEASRDAALLVVGSRGLGAVRGAVLGSVSARVLGATPATVLVVHGLPAAGPA